MELGSVEYALEHLNTPMIIVMGYENCGAIKVVEENAQAEGNLTILLANIKKEPKVQQIKHGTLYRANVLVQANVSHVIRQFQSQPGVLGEKFRSGH